MDILIKGSEKNVNPRYILLVHERVEWWTEVNMSNDFWGHNTLFDENEFANWEKRCDFWTIIIGSTSCCEGSGLCDLVSDNYNDQTHFLLKSTVLHHNWSQKKKLDRLFNLNLSFVLSLTNQKYRLTFFLFCNNRYRCMYVAAEPVFYFKTNYCDLKIMVGKRIGPALSGVKKQQFTT